MVAVALFSARSLALIRGDGARLEGSIDHDVVFNKKVHDPVK